MDRLDTSDTRIQVWRKFHGHDVSTEDVGKTALVPQKEEKGELSMGPMVTSGWVEGLLGPAEESVSLVGKSTGMPATTSGGFAPHTAGVGQMKLEAPPRYSGKRQPGARVWLTQMERYMRLMRYAPTDWLDVVAMRVEGAASSWVNAVLQEISEGRRPVFRTWAQFRDAMVQRFEPVTEVEEAQAAQSIEADRPSRRLRPEIPGAAVSASWND